ncbi:hypothetical protein [Phaeobacter gallaeciensis]|uniref:hypothetical protein n=1 Tax=Phaeobacter gallaeciensis TaxID=60890 RepID=UPI00237EFAA2|nr:hypothetical protein [Phaeobacter gallaeciensis]MDE4100071.1 hypothetical protein [Phaeobacter gallaeciensis]MDE4108888.1 hypothetical protein [Phaeobacter gallaeciensis]MDE4113334.1 hypothetical protein [Phaeobacter gallaeciensis]MDE4117748.1 hypothetical protein [Phaeobacter gallaeciensis]
MICYLLVFNGKEIRDVETHEPFTYIQDKNRAHMDCDAEFAAARMNAALADHPAAAKV